MAADASAADPRVAGTVLIDAWDIGKEKAGITDPAARKAAIEGMRPDTLPLAGTSAELLVKEIETTRPSWTWRRSAPASPTGRC
jgi:hypothetical protein